MENIWLLKQKTRTANNRYNTLEYAVERETRFELATSTLARLRSTN